jgi:hypothetical protein
VTGATGRAVRRSMPGTGLPVIAQPLGPGDALPYGAVWSEPGGTEDRTGGRPGDELLDGLADELHAISAPDDLRERLVVG